MCELVGSISAVVRVSIAILVVVELCCAMSHVVGSVRLIKLI